MPRYQSNNAQRPGKVTAIRGIVFQSDGQSTIGRAFIRPMETLDRWIVHALPSRNEPPLAMHAGVRVEIDGTRDYVAEQLVGSLDMDLRNGLNWTPYADFHTRDHEGGWDVTVPATSFRGVDQAVVNETIANLNAIQGHPFAGEDCTAFVERAFGRRLFADSPLLRSFGIGVRVGDPALPLVKPNPEMDARARELLQIDEIEDLPDPLADAESPNGRVWLRRVVPMVILGALVGRALASVYSSSSRKSTPFSSTARKFLR